MNNTTATEIQYPYYASPERERTILEGYKRVTSGMSASEVKEILGEPDEIKDLYAPNITSTKKIGITCWYLIQRISNSGSQNDKKRKAGSDII